MSEAWLPFVSSGLRDGTCLALGPTGTSIENNAGAVGEQRLSIQSLMRESRSRRSGKEGSRVRRSCEEKGGKHSDFGRGASVSGTFGIRSRDIQASSPTDTLHARLHLLCHLSSLHSSIVLCVLDSVGGGCRCQITAMPTSGCKQSLQHRLYQNEVLND